MALERTLSGFAVLLFLLLFFVYQCYQKPTLVGLEEEASSLEEEAFKNARAQRIEAVARSSNFTFEELDTLDRTLDASKINDTVIITAFNEAWSKKDGMMDLFLDSFHQGNGTIELLDHMVIVTMDHASYNRCLEVNHSHCYALKTEGVDFSGEKLFRTEDYYAMMWRRTYFLYVVLQLGYGFVFTDSDVLWFRNPFPHFHPEADFELACDLFNGNEDDRVNNWVNTGFIRVSPNNSTIALYDLWYGSRLTYPDHNEQDVYNYIKDGEKFQNLGLKIKYLSTDLFSGFCQVSRDLVRVVTLHSNCCVGLRKKLEVLKRGIEIRKRFLMPPRGNRTREATKNPWKNLHC